MQVSKCRLCEGELSEPKLGFPATPLANEFFSVRTEQEKFPLQVCLCLACGHYQLNESIPPERLFRQDYPFVTGTSPANVAYFKQYAQDVAARAGLVPGDLVVDLASSDGTVLQHFKDLGMRVLGVEPAQNIAQIANDRGIETIPEFFNSKLAQEIVEKYGQPKLVTANNVIAHLSYVKDFVHGVKTMMTESSMFVFEVSYFADVTEHLLIDTIYHEHESYYCVTPLVKFFSSQEMTLVDAQRVSPHGGSLRGYVKTGELVLDPDSQARVANLKLKERAICIQSENPKVIDMEMMDVRNRIAKLQFGLRRKIKKMKNDGKKIAIYGYPAKATTLSYLLDLDPKDFEFAVEDNPLKCGKFSPGLQIPIVKTDELYIKGIDCCLVLAWNFAESIIKKHTDFKGKWIVPLPILKEI